MNMMQPGYSPRFPHCTVIEQNRKYFDSETGKFIRDKMPALKGYSLSDIIDDSIHNNMHYNFKGYFHLQEEQSPIFNFPKFTPKDNDFDLEPKKEKKAKELEKNKILDQLAANAANRANLEAQQKKLDEKKNLLKEQNDMIYIGGPNHGQRIAYVKRNTWIPK